MAAARDPAASWVDLSTLDEHVSSVRAAQRVSLRD